MSELSAFSLDLSYLGSADWVWQLLTIAAAMFQTARNASQRTLSQRISALGASYVRFLFGLPVAVVWLALVAPSFVPSGMQHPGAFLSWCAWGGILQILGNGCLLLAMKDRNFMVSVAYSKTEAVQAALFGILLLGEALRLSVTVALVAATAGTMMITFTIGGVRPVDALGAVASRGAVYGLLCGAMFGISATTYRAAALSSGETPFIGAAYTLLAVLVIQTVVLTVYIAATRREVFGQVLRNVRMSAFSGVMGGLASLCWFTAMALHSIADVRALGLTEMLFSYFASRRLYHEGMTLPELSGTILIGGSALLIVLL